MSKPQFVKCMQMSQTMGIYCEHFRCVELLSEKSEISSYPTRWGAAKRCHKLNQWNPLERWVVRSCGIHYVPDYNEQRRFHDTEIVMRR